MATIVPIRGIRYSQDRVGDLSQVVTPPYDIIDAAAQARYYARHPHNIIRLELGQTFAQDDKKNNRYTRAANYFNRWQKEEVILKEKEPALYLYEQEFTVKGKKMLRAGFFCGVKVEDYSKGNILPHEETLSKPKADRLQLMRSCRANFSPVFGLYADSKNEIIQSLVAARQNKPNVDFIDESGEAHRLWVITDPKIISAVADQMADKPIFIADGHHRYETALDYAEEMRLQGQNNYDTVLMVLVNLYDPGMLILPTHRIVKNIRNFDIEDFKNQLSNYFEIEAFPLSPGKTSAEPEIIDSFFNKMEEQGKNIHTFGLYTKEKVLYLLTLKPECSLDDILDQNKSAAWRKLDVAILDNLVLDKLLSIGSEQRQNQEHLEYTHNEKEALEMINTGEAQLSFFLNPTRVEEVIEVALANDKMPQKSTYFYPKLITGLIINPLGE